jgi:hypothetical protein
MVVSRGNGNIAGLIVRGFMFQVVNDIKYLGTNINNSNNMHNEIILRISAANKGYFLLVKLFKSKFQIQKFKDKSILGLSMSKF